MGNLGGVIGTASLKSLLASASFAPLAMTGSNISMLQPPAWDRFNESRRYFMARGFRTGRRVGVGDYRAGVFAHGTGRRDVEPRYPW